MESNFCQLLNALRQTQIYTADPLLFESSSEIAIETSKSYKSSGIIQIPVINSI